eukprot:Polyplicarium_translucidae@DN3405_c1_g1_i5.p1
MSMMPACSSPRRGLVLHISGSHKDARSSKYNVDDARLQLSEGRSFFTFPDRTRMHAAASTVSMMPACSSPRRGLVLHSSGSHKDARSSKYNVDDARLQLTEGRSFFGSHKDARSSKYNVDDARLQFTEARSLSSRFRIKSKDRTAAASTMSMMPACSSPRRFSVLHVSGLHTERASSKCSVDGAICSCPRRPFVLPIPDSHTSQQVPMSMMRCSAEPSSTHVAVSRIAASTMSMMHVRGDLHLSGSLFVVRTASTMLTMRRSLPSPRGCT